MTNDATHRPGSDSRVLDVDRTPAARSVNLAVKVALVASFAIAVGLTPDTVEGKAMGFRAPLFLAPPLIVPILARVRGWDPYPHTADALLCAPFLIDTLGNLLGVYDGFDRTDDVLHALNWVLLVGAYHAFRFRVVRDRRDAVLLGYGFGAIAIVWWEIMEWAVSEDGFGGAGGLALTYVDTIGDLFLSSTGGLVGSIVAVRWLGPPRSDGRNVAVESSTGRPIG
ncbi:hypothetical protein [Ilumatobacter sp.]|uniref:hypothetical protein n=1 Tax=Ilumatobacter sp. TaxID=1967498 RepID=UPI003B51E56E